MSLPSDGTPFAAAAASAMVVFLGSQYYECQRSRNASQQLLELCWRSHTPPVKSDTHDRAVSCRWAIKKIFADNAMCISETDK
jgi:hypothetical protein